MSSISNLAPDYLQFVPLINAVLPVEFPETEVTQALTGYHRTMKTNTFLIELLKNSDLRVLLLGMN